MANLIALFIDKDTGELVATNNTSSGSPSGPLIGRGDGYFHLQSVSSAVWTITHNEGTEFVLVQVYTTAGDLIIPDEVSIVDINTVEVTLGSSATGRAHIIFFEPV